MHSFMKSLKASTAGMAAQGERLRLVSENVANAHTPGYRRKLVSFTEALDSDSGANMVKVSGVRLDGKPLKRVYDPSHPLKDKTGHVEMSNVDVLVEIADAREAQRSFEANMNMFDQARRMYSGVIELIKRP
ncbi:MAG: flagellar basal body rod protein FlgC [Neomegalonema sp.]|nr:flagellar basal body rod protein FlgC [Neomegalonema sp.]